MEKAMVTHSSTLAWKIPWMEEPGGLQSMGSLRVGHDWVTSLSFFTLMHWRRKWQPTPVFLPGDSQGRGSLVGCRLWGRTESDTTEATQQQQCCSVFLYFYYFCTISLYYLLYYRLVLSTTENIMLKFSTVFVNLSMSPFGSINLCFTWSHALLLGT